MASTQRFLTGRSRTLNLSGPISGICGGKISAPLVGFTLGDHAIFYANVDGFPGFRSSWVAFDAFQVVGTNPVIRVHLQVSSTLDLGIAGEPVWANTQDGHVEAPFGNPYDYTPMRISVNITGSWNLQVTLQEVAVITLLDDEAGLDEEKLPPRLSIVFQERYDPDTAMSLTTSMQAQMTITRGGNSYSGSASVSATVSGRISDVFPNNQRNFYIHQNAYSMRATAQLRYRSLANSLPAGPLFAFSEVTIPSSLPFPVSDPNLYREVSDTFGYVRAWMDSQKCRAEVQKGNISAYTDIVAAEYLYGTKRANVPVMVKAINAPYDANLAVTIKTKKDPSNNPVWEVWSLPNGTGSGSIEQKAWFASWQLPGNSGALSLSEYVPVEFRLTSDSLSSAKDDPQAHRLWGHGWSYDALRISHQTTYVLDTCNTLSDTQRSWTSLQDCTLSASGGAIRITPTGSQPKFRRQCLTPSYERWDTYSFLRILLKSQNAGKTLRLKVNGKEYSIQTIAADTWQEFYVDLCLPENRPEDYDQQTTSYPFGRSDGPYWGISQTDKIDFEADPDEWHISELSLNVYPPDPPDHPEYDHALYVMPSREWWVQRKTSENWLCRRFLTGVSDGKQALEIEDARYQATSFGKVLQWLSIQELANRVLEKDTSAGNAPYWPGWNVEILTSVGQAPPEPQPLSPFFLNHYRPATYLLGAGLLYHHSTGQWETKAWRNPLGSGSGGIILQAQILFDIIDWYPGAGNVWQGGSYGSPNTPIVLALGTVLRAAAFGIVGNTLHQRVQTGAVQLFRVMDNANGGQAQLSEWRGAFYTGQPFASGTYQYTLNPMNIQAQTTVRTYRTRLPLRTVLIAQPPTVPWKYYVQETIDGEHVVELFVQEPGNLFRKVKVRISGFGTSFPSHLDTETDVAFTTEYEEIIGIACAKLDTLYVWTLDTQSNLVYIYRWLLSWQGGQLQIARNILLAGGTYPSKGLAARHYHFYSGVMGGWCPEEGIYDMGVQRTVPTIHQSVLADTAAGFVIAPNKMHGWNPQHQLITLISSEDPSRIAIWRVSSVSAAGNAYRAVLLGVLSDANMQVLKANAFLQSGRIYLFAFGTTGSGSGATKVAKLMRYAYLPLAPGGQILTPPEAVHVICTGNDADAVFREGLFLAYERQEDSASRVYLLSSGGPPYAITI